MTHVTQLIAGANIGLAAGAISVQVKQRSSQGSTLADISAYLLAQDTLKVRGDQDMLFYGQPKTASGSVQLIQQADLTTFQFDLNKIDPAIEKIALCATLDAPFTLAVLQTIDIEIVVAGQLIATASIAGQGRSEAALIVGELYRRNQEWKFRLVAQGFNGGLKPLAQHFGVEISDDPAPAPAPAPRINLSKITLDKTNNKINLTKQSQDFGEIKINLNWNRQNNPAQNTSLLKRLTGGSSRVDLDLGCLFEMQDGTKSVIQALGNRFGTLHDYPYIQLSADDRTGQSSSGEWLSINGKYWDQIKRVVIFAFIYEGAPNWAATDAVVTIHAPQQPPIEVKLTEGKPLGMCGIVELSNLQGSIQVARHVQYVPGHRELDQQFGFGLRWQAGSK